MDLRSMADGTLAFFRPDPMWRRRAAEMWLAAWAVAALFVLAVIVMANRASDVLTVLDANLAFGFARVDPPIVYQEIRGRYAYCGYDWDRQCQLRDPMSPQPPPVDRWLALYPPSFQISAPPAQADVVFMESQGASSLVDDPRFADAEYVLGLQDVTAHVFGTMAAGGLSTIAAIAIALLFGFATFGGQRSRAINPLWVWFALVATGFYAWAAVHI